MPTFTRGQHSSLPARHIAYRDRAEAARASATGDTTTSASTTTRGYEQPDPVDLRGIPAIGLGVAGHIRGTQPESAATR